MMAKKAAKKTTKKTVKRRRGGKKGGEYERDICKQLGLWWTEGKRDDIFWRSSNSGGRATVRGRKGQTTQGQHGDVAATDPIGAPLLDLVAIEIKRGYSIETLHSLFDRAKNAGQQMYEAWIQQAVTAHQQSGSYSWIIITKRDGREPLVIMDALLVDALKEAIAAARPRPFVTCSTRIRYKHKLAKDKFEYTVHTHRFSIMLWSDWKKIIDPKDIRRLVKKL